jgi:putative colanic acid biosynthesis UDP-glucose lipid carrier transferase
MTIDYSEKLRVPPIQDRSSSTVGHTRGSEASVTAVFWVQWVSAVCAMAALLVALSVDKIGDVSSPYRVLGIITLFASYPVYSLLRVYDYRATRVVVVLRLSLAWAAVIAMLTVVGFVTKTSESYSRQVLLLWFIGGWFLQLSVMVALQAIFQRYYEARLTLQNALVLGSGACAQQVADILNRQRLSTVVGLISDTDTEDNSFGNGLYPVVGSLSDLRRLIIEKDIRRLYIALPSDRLGRLEEIYLDLLDTSVDVVWVPDFGNTLLLNHSVGSLNGMPAIYLNESPLTSYPSAALVKSLIDRLAALILLILSSPILIGVALAVKLSSSGPVFFKQDRHGLNGNIFPMWKFRSMRIHSDTDVKQATKGDSRITPVGAFIRKTSIDELPQLFNVLFGHMSLVGPRPHAVQHNNYYSDKIQAYMTRHKVKPGMTGWAQVNGSRGETETIEKMKRRLELDLEYINNWSLWLDLQVLLKTPLALLRDEAY